MPRIGLRSLVAACLCAVCGVIVSVQPASAQNATRGFNLTLPAHVDAADMALQPDLWVMEVSFKPMRMIRVDITDPITKKKESRLVWYLVWRAVNRSIERPAEQSVAEPVNDKDYIQPPVFVPEFTLVTNDNGVQHVYPDEIIPEAQAAIAARERVEVKSNVEIVQPLPEAVPADAEPKTVLQGVAMWSHVDPNTDYFNVFATGFGSAYRITEGPDNKPLVWRKTIVLEFWRPSDAVDQKETEIRRLDELQPSTKAQHAPRWIYRADGDVSPHPQDLPTDDGAKPAAGEASEAAPAEEPAAENNANPN